MLLIKRLQHECSSMSSVVRFARIPACGRNAASHCTISSHALATALCLFASLLMGLSLATQWPHSGHTRATHGPHMGHCILLRFLALGSVASALLFMDLYLQFSGCAKTSVKHSGPCVAHVWPLCGHCVATVWPMRGHCLANASQWACAAKKSMRIIAAARIHEVFPMNPLSKYSPDREVPCDSSLDDYVGMELYIRVDLWIQHTLLELLIACICIASAALDHMSINISHLQPPGIKSVDFAKSSFALSFKACHATEDEM